MQGVLVKNTRMTAFLTGTGAILAWEFYALEADLSFWTPEACAGDEWGAAAVGAVIAQNGAVGIVPREDRG